MRTSSPTPTTFTVLALLALSACGEGPGAGEIVSQATPGDGAIASDARQADAADNVDSGSSVGAVPTHDATAANGAPDGQAGGNVDADLDASPVESLDSGVTSDAGAGADAAASDGASQDSSQADAADSVGGATCELPTTFKWTGGGPLAQPKNGAVSMKDFAHAFHNGQHILYFTTFQTGWGSAMMTFRDWPEAATAPQIKTSFGVAPTLFYFRPKNVWVLAYQWGPHKFSYRTSSDPSNANGWSAEKSLYNTALPPTGTGPIDQTVICDSARCYLYYAGDNGHIYKSSMPIGSFPGEFPAAQDSGIVGTTQNLFEAVQVYRLKGTNKYLMIVEAQGSARYFRAWTSSSLEGPWTLLTNDFAVKKNVTLTTNWTNDISHGDLVRTSPDETFTIDACNLQLVFQGRDPSVNTDYGRLPYRLGLITLQR